MKKKIFGIISLCFLLAVMLVNLDLNKSNKKNNELFLKNVIALAKANGETGSECTRSCFDANCEAVWEDVHCVETCGSTSCDFTFAKRI